MQLETISTQSRIRMISLDNYKVEADVFDGQNNSTNISGGSINDPNGKYLGSFNIVMPKDMTQEEVDKALEEIAQYAKAVVKRPENDANDSQE